MACQGPPYDLKPTNLTQRPVRPRSTAAYVVLLNAVPRDPIHYPFFAPLKGLTRRA